MKPVFATFKEETISKGITFPKDSTYRGYESQDGMIYFPSGTVSGSEHIFSRELFSKIKADLVFETRNEDEDMNALPRVMVTPKVQFVDQEISFDPKDQYAGRYDGTNGLVCFPVGAVSSKRHKIPFKFWKENLASLYSTTPETPAPETPGMGTAGITTE